MAASILTADQLREVLDYDATTGIFTRKTRLAQRHKVGDRADFEVTGKGSLRGYHRVSLFSKRYLAHRVAWLYVYGEWPDGILDHINGAKGDNRIENLRIASHAMNIENQRLPRKDNISGYLGVYWHPESRKWCARIQVNRKGIHIGLYDCPKEAHVAYVKKKRKYHEGCTI